jgi:hypothetical protein
MRFYTYKVTFKDLPKYFYYGRKKSDGKSYFGTPVTWKKLWDMFEPEVQILQWYDTAEEADKAERAIIKATWDSPFSLNENCGGLFSEASVSKGGISNTPKQKATRKKNAKRMNLHPNTVEARKAACVNGGKSNTPAQQKARRETGLKNSERVNSQKWMSLIDGYVSTASGVALHNKNRGWDTTAKVKVKDQGVVQCK